MFFLFVFWLVYFDTWKSRARGVQPKKKQHSYWFNFFPVYCFSPSELLHSDWYSTCRVLWKWTVPLLVPGEWFLINCNYVFIRIIWCYRRVYFLEIGKLKTNRFATSEMKESPHWQKKQRKGKMHCTIWRDNDQTWHLDCTNWSFSTNRLAIFLELCKGLNYLTPCLWHRLTVER